MKCHSGLFMHTFAIVVGWKFTVKPMGSDTEWWDVWIQRNIVQGIYGGSGTHFTTCSREVLVSYIISKVTASGIHVSFKDAKTEGSLLLEFFKPGSRAPYLWAVISALDGNRCGVYTVDNRKISEELKLQTQFACVVCSNYIFP